MKIDGVHIAAATVWLPDRISQSEDAVAEGILDARDLALCPARAVRIAETGCWEMGMAACVDLIKAGDVDAAEIALLAYAGASLTEEDPWSPPHRIARLLGAREAAALGIFQMSNGGAAAVGQAIAALLLEPRSHCAIAVASSDFRKLPYPRWASAPDVIYGDGAAAALLCDRPGPFVVRSLSSVGNPMLEATFPVGHPFKLSAGGKAANGGFATNAAAIRKAVAKAVDHALDDAAIEADDPRIVAVYPTRLGRLVFRQCVQPALPEPLRGRGVLLGEETGHLGAGDMLANLAHLMADRSLPTGAVALLITTGAGFTASCLVVEKLSIGARTC
ncbi:3-oxoacyl-[acyl-carrier-protein] synthase III C-terminal domain-containing protein [Nocardia sp. XZ_19_385]|uniref:3-oxoacyl-[acyl-carrier-protein] synthase III C-terminal domain-containing protein n=1 Tax=Nocardia sp. XZ_19_385 TaxID=2769488 RepID=UPI00189084E5|nr:3-oxoacyl-[acyl-carrier-protein] synthase III C-terminal domain-containing protein [Nocardia sp. XZ_19_385]